MNPVVDDWESLDEEPTSDLKRPIITEAKKTVTADDDWDTLPNTVSTGITIPVSEILVKSDTSQPVQSAFGIQSSYQPTVRLLRRQDRPPSTESNTLPPSAVTVQPDMKTREQMYQEAKQRIWQQENK